MKKILILILKAFGLYGYYRVPGYVLKNQRHISQDKLDNIRKIIVTKIYAASALHDERVLADINAQTYERLEHFRKTHIPFLVETAGLENKKVLEIGCGSGSSTVALCEQGAIVTGIDINDTYLAIADERLKEYNLRANLIKTNSEDIDELFKNEKWDYVIFYAVMEHMLPSERIKSLRSAYNLLDKGGHLCVLGTPNRLWYEDIHTSMLPFYFWLQDEIAIEYSRFSKRMDFNDLHKQKQEDKSVNLYRWGIGLSYHEFEIAIKEATKLKVAGSMPIFIRRYNLFQSLSYKMSDEYKYKKILSKAGPKGLHPGFYEPYIDLIIEKD